jgi:signal peptidase I
VTDVILDDPLIPGEEPGDSGSVVPESQIEPNGRRWLRVGTVVFASTVVLLVAFLAAAGAWLLTGGRFYVVSTPSMSPKVPVGSLVLTRPAPAGGPHVGQIIAFHPPAEPNTTYTHRVYKVLPDGAYQTKGDLDPTPDAWVITKQNVVGVAVANVRGLGFLVRALPWLAGGAVLVIAFAAFMPRNRRRLCYLVGGCLVVSVAILIVNPLVRGLFVSSGASGNRVHALVVNTGLLPMRFTMHGAVAQHAPGGYPVTLQAPKPAGPHGLVIHGAVDLSLLGWILLVLVCLSPLLIAILVPVERWIGPAADADEADDAEDLGDLDDLGGIGDQAEGLDENDGSGVLGNASG